MFFKLQEYMLASVFQETQKLPVLLYFKQAFNIDNMSLTWQK